ncbi:hypothetical protein WN51_14532 [Melipona quadrifasciata]|uniref:Uncharacterized protein n=1 Tax=Melipona quadrifasciata TaxID=166423 RepID=A0A0M8ZZV9_9HYME|nr:hypothetical protein WN51_14532 [Melipona quadrifasciata]
MALLKIVNRHLGFEIQEIRRTPQRKMLAIARKVETKSSQFKINPQFHESEIQQLFKNAIATIGPTIGNVKFIKLARISQENGGKEELLVNLAALMVKNNLEYHWDDKKNSNTVLIDRVELKRLSSEVSFVDIVRSNPILHSAEFPSFSTSVVIFPKVYRVKDVKEYRTECIKTSIVRDKKNKIRTYNCRTTFALAEALNIFEQRGLVDSVVWVCWSDESDRFLGPELSVLPLHPLERNSKLVQFCAGRMFIAPSLSDNSGTNDCKTFIGNLRKRNSPSDQAVRNVKSTTTDKYDASFEVSPRNTQFPNGATLQHQPRQDDCLLPPALQRLRGELELGRLDRRVRAEDGDLPVAAARARQREHARRWRQTEVLRDLPLEAGVREQAAPDLRVQTLLPVKVVAALRLDGHDPPDVLAGRRQEAPVVALGAGHVRLGRQGQGLQALRVLYVPLVRAEKVPRGPEALHGSGRHVASGGSRQQQFGILWGVIPQIRIVVAGFMQLREDNFYGYNPTLSSIVQADLFPRNPHHFCNCLIVIEQVTVVLMESIGIMDSGSLELLRVVANVLGFWDQDSKLWSLALF